MSKEEVIARRFGPNQKDGPCADPAVICCAMWECQSRNRCKKSFSTAFGYTNPNPTTCI